MMRRLLFVAGLGFLLATPLAAQQREITGRVTAASTGDALAGAEVYIEGTRLGALADEDGNFSIRVPEGDVTLRANFLGYKSEAVPVPAGQNTVQIALKEDVLELEGVVVTGVAATVQRRNAANAVAVVSGDQLDKAPTPSIENALQGRVAGANIEENSGAPGGGIQVSFRGVSSINADAEPLYVVDGVLVSNNAVQSGADAITNATGGGAGDPQDNPVNRIADLDVRDIERVEVLKGASAAAIYGAKAANGVVIITTKHGNEGKPQVNLSGRLGTFDRQNSFGSRRFNSVEEAVATFGPQAADVFTGRTFDHEDQLFGKNDVSFEGSGNVSGGSGNTRYYASGLVKHDAGIAEGTGYQKQSGRVNLDQKIGSSLDLSLNTNLIHTVADRFISNNDNSGTSPYVVLSSTPSFINLEPTNGVYPINPFARSNPIQTEDLLTNSEDVFRLIGSFRGSYDLVQGEKHNLQFIGDVGADHFNLTSKIVSPPELQFEPLDGLPGTAVLTDGTNTNLNTSANLAYTYSPGPDTWSSTSTGGVQYSESDLKTTTTTTRNLIPGQGNVDQGSSVDVNDNRQRIEELGFYGQEELLLAHERMLLTAGLRADRSSANGDDNKYFVFPKGSASYRFVSPASWLDELKLRAAVGQTGNRPLFGQKFTALASGNIDNQTGIVIDDAVIAGDATIKPERQTEYETGFDATLFGERAALEFSVYQRTITDLILLRTLAPSTGVRQQVFNGGELRNRGVEVALSLTPVLTDRFNWLFRTTFFSNQSEITDLPVPTFQTGGFGTALGSFQIEKGESATQIVANDGEDAAGNSIINKLGDAQPDFRMSFSNEIRWQGLNLSFLLDWKKGGDVINLTRLLYDAAGNSEDFLPSGGGECPTVVPTARPGDPGYPTVDSPGCMRIGAFGTFTQQYIEDASYLKLRDVSLNYDIAPLLQNGLFGQPVSYVRIGVSGRNLFTITPYTGLDPEVSNFGNRAIDRNIDVAPFPPSRSMWLTVDVGF